jgi:hypothetical protein
MLGVIGACRVLPLGATAAVVVDDGHVAAVAFREAERLLVSRAADGVLGFLAEELRAEPAAAVLGNPESVEAVCRTMARPAGFALLQGVYENHQVSRPRRADGRMRAAALADLETILEWHTDLAGELRDATPAAVARASIAARIEAGAFFVWEVDDAIVSSAAAVAPTRRGIRINTVYTAEAARGHGYASNLVAAVTQLMLDRGREFAFLHTDLANPISNRIYEQIGYRRVASFLMRRLRPDE